MEVVIQLSADLAAAMQGKAAAPLPDTVARMKRALDEQLARHRTSLRPTHPGVEDSELQRYYTLSLADDVEAEAVLLALRGVEGVTAAYAKPEAEPA